MGWYPARDKNNRVIPGTLNFPQPDRESGVNIIKIKRGSTTRNDNGKGVSAKSRYAQGLKLLAEQAISMGWLNGHKIKKGGVR